MAQATATQIYEHNGKKYRLVDKRDIGKYVWVSDEGFQDAVVRDPYTAELREYRPEPPAGWRYVAEDEVLVEGDVYMHKTGDIAGSVWSGKGSAVSKLKAGGSWHNNWVGVIRKKPSPEAPEPNFEASWLNTMCETIHAKNVAAGWWDAADNPLVVPTKIALIVSECAEALEGHRRDAMDDKLTHRKALDTELADVFIRLCDLAGFLKVPLGTIVAEKEAYNASRADHKPEVRKSANGKRY